MTYAEKRAYVDELILRVQAEIVAKLPKMPEEWDGHELRRYIADQFEDYASLSFGRGADRRRLLAYKNTVLVDNL